MSMSAEQMVVMQQFRRAFCGHLDGKAALEERAAREPDKSEAIRTATLAYWATEDAASS